MLFEELYEIRYLLLKLNLNIPKVFVSFLKIQFNFNRIQILKVKIVEYLEFLTEGKFLTYSTILSHFHNVSSYEIYVFAYSG